MFRLYRLHLELIPPLDDPRGPRGSVPGRAQRTHWSMCTPSTQNGRSVDYDDHCTVVVVIDDLPKRSFLTHHFGNGKNASGVEEMSEYRANDIQN